MEWIKANLGRVAIAMLFIVSTILGVTYPIASPPGTEVAGSQGMDDVWAIDYWGTELASINTDGDLTLAGDLSLVDLTVSGDATVGDTLDVNGDIDLDGDGFDVDITAGASIDTDGATNLSASAGDITIEAETGSVTIKGDESDAAAVFIDADQAVTTGLDINVGSVSGVTIDGGLTDIGGGTYATANGDNDLGVAGDLEVDGAADLDGSLTVAGLVFFSFADETITDGETLTPTVMVYALDSGGAVTMTLAASATEGQILILIGDDANNITINDTNIRTNDGSVQVINQFDVIMFVYQDAEWIEISESNNS